MKQWNLGAWLLALLMVSCGGETEPVVEQRTEGTLKLPLVSPAPDGRTYKLVGATFTITGPQTVTLTDTSTDTVQTTLLAGTYTVELGGTWHMERVDVPGTPVPAQLLSPNPLPFFVKKGETTEVRFLFKLPGEGTANVGIVVDSGGWLAGTIPFTEREYPGQPGMFDGLLGKSVPFVIGFESYTTTKSNWSPELYVEATASIVQFGGPPSEVLGRVATSLKGARLYFGLVAGNGFTEFGGLHVMSPSGPFQFDLLPGRFQGAVGSDGYPLFQPFELQTPAALRSASNYDAVRGPATVNVSP